MTTAEIPHPKDKLVILKRVPIFASCTEAQLPLIAERTRIVEYKKGEFVYRARQSAEAFRVVVSGRLRVLAPKDASTGKQRTLSILHDGDTLGEISLLTGERHATSVQAINDTLVLQLQKRDFEEVINRIPSLVLHLSRMLSRRLRAKQQADEFSESTIAAIYSATKGVGRTLFAASLAAMLVRDTCRPVIVVDMNPAGADQEQLYGAEKPRQIKLSGIQGFLSEAKLNQLLHEHALGFSVLSVGTIFAEREDDQAVAPLLSMLTKRYSYILIDLPVEVDAQVLKALTQSDLIYLMIDQHRDNLVRTKVLLHQVREAVAPVEQRVKVVVNLMQGIGIPVSLEEISHELGSWATFPLPRAILSGKQMTAKELGAQLEQQASSYARTMRRIERELSGMLVGLALGSGAALGLAHIGVIKILERERIPIDMIAGSSIGALIGGLWASGRSAAEIERMAIQFKNPWDIRRLFLLDFAFPGVSVIFGLIAGAVVWSLGGILTGVISGLLVALAAGLALGIITAGPIKGTQLMAKLREDFADKTFRETIIPLKVIAANPMTREEVVFDSGPIAKAVRASVSIPGIFKPARYEGKICLDGGVVNPVPVSVLRQAGIDRVIAVNVFPGSEELIVYRQKLARERAEKEAELASKSLPIRVFARLKQEIVRSVSPMVFDVIMRSMQSMEHQIAEVVCRGADLTLRPTVPGSHWLQFHNPEQFIRRGEEIALKYLSEIKRLTLGEDREIDNHESGQ